MSRPRSAAERIASRDPSPFRPPVPMKPMRGLFVALMGVLAVWCVAMLVMYFKAIQPAATQPSQPQPVRATAPALAQTPH